MNAIALNPPIQLRYYQHEAVEAIFKFFEEHGGTGLDGQPIKANPLIALPTGTGKSLVIGEAIRQAFSMHSGMRVVMATHVKELIKQNRNQMLKVWPGAPIGVYSAGLKSKDCAQPIIFGGIQSLVGKYPIFGFRDWLIIDEAHLLADEGSYARFIEELLARNPYLKVIGLTATPYRMGLGLITNGKIFTHVAYDLTDIAGFNRLIAEGFLCPLIPKRPDTQLDVSSVGMSKGEYNQGVLKAAVDIRDINYKALNEFVFFGKDRASWLVFASGIQHAEHLGEMLNDVFNIDTVVIHSEKSEADNEAALKAWKKGEVRCAVNMNALTTGVDHPALDYIGMLRPTMSTGLWVQMLGRGTRPYEGKTNCLVMDFAGNTRRLGPINDPVIPKLKGQGPPGDAPVRICPNCGTYNHATAKVCVMCGEEFPIHTKLTGTASEEELLRSDLPQIEEFNVARVIYSIHINRATKNRSVKASYFCGLRTFYQWVDFESTKSLARHKAHEWLRQRWGDPWEGITNDQVIQICSQLRTPTKIKVWVNKQPSEVTGVEF